MNTDNEQEENWLTEAKQCADEQAYWFTEMIVEKASDLNIDLECYSKQVIKRIKKNIKQIDNENGEKYEIRSEN